MVAKKKAEEGGEKAGRKTRKLNVWLSPEQIEFLKEEKGGPSAAVRALITEAMQLQNLSTSVKSGAKKRPRK